MQQKQAWKLSFLISFGVLAGCLGDVDPAADHPCQLENNCLYDTSKGESNCVNGYTWENPNDLNNYNCVEIRGAT